MPALDRETLARALEGVAVGLYDHAGALQMAGLIQSNYARLAAGKEDRG